MSYACKILADSISRREHRLTTFEITFPRFILAEVNTHRMLSRNSASSRAIPVEKRIAAVLADPFIPKAFARNQRGMQAGGLLTDLDQGASEHAWLLARDEAIKYARILAGLEVHKQWANRLLEPFGWHTAIVSATDWDNFFNLRDNSKASPEFKDIAHEMRVQYEHNLPKVVPDGEWHLPMVDFDDEIGVPPEGDDLYLIKISAGRCARVSYLTHYGKRDPQADIDLTDGLVSNVHMSPLEHPARAMTEDEIAQYARFDWRTIDGVEEHVYRGSYCGNYNGWIQYRKLIPGEAVAPREDA